MARDFDGSTGALRSTSSPGLLPPWIISLWIYPDSLPSSGNLKYFWTRQNTVNWNNYYGLYLSPSGTVGYWRHVLGSASGVESSTGLSTGQWSNVVAYDDGLDWYIYLNGGSKGSKHITGPTVGAVPHTCIGARETANTPTFADYFDGRVAELVEWDNDDGFGGPVIAGASLDSLASDIHNRRGHPELHSNPGKCRYTPLLRDEDVSLLMPNANPMSTFGVTGTVGIAEHVPLAVRGLIGLELSDMDA